MVERTGADRPKLHNMTRVVTEAGYGISGATANAAGMSQQAVRLEHGDQEGQFRRSKDGQQSSQQDHGAADQEAAADACSKDRPGWNEGYATKVLARCEQER